MAVCRFLDMVGGMSPIFESGPSHFNELRCSGRCISADGLTLGPVPEHNSCVVLSSHARKQTNEEPWIRRHSRSCTSERVIPTMS